MDLKIQKHKKKRKCNLEDVRRSGMDKLPCEIAHDILSRLPITSVIQSRVVNRAWHTLSLDHNLISLHNSRVAKQEPFLIFHCDFPIRNQLYFVHLSDFDDNKPIVVKKFHTPFCESMPEFKVVGSCNGILCLSGSLCSDSVYVYNPFTRDYKELPETRQYQVQEVVFGFGCYPGTNNYKVVKIVYHWTQDIGIWPATRFHTRPSLKSEVHVFTFGSTTWKSIGEVPYMLETPSPEAVFINGRLHWLTKLRTASNVRNPIILSFDFSDEQFHEVPGPDIGRPRVLHNSFLALLDGYLSSVYRSGLELDIWVMKEYGVKESWIREFRIRISLPKSVDQSLQLPWWIWKNTYVRKSSRVLYILNNGRVLIEYKIGRLALYEPNTGLVREVAFLGMPNMFHTFVHIGSLNGTNYTY